MAIVETVVVGHVAGFCLLLAWAIRRRGAVDLIAGYDGDLPPEREAVLARDAAAVLADHDRPLRSMLGMDAVPGPGRRLALLPTTAGTGSEVTHVAVFADHDAGGVKKVLYSRHLFADLAVVDPDLTATLPAGVAAATGLDALTHAVEAYVTRRRTPYSDMLARRAVELLADGLRPAVLQGAANDRARARVSLAATLAGQAFVNSGLGAVHALTYPLGVDHGVGHGRANAVLLPAVMEFNVPSEVGRFGDLARWLGAERRPGDSDREFAARSVDRVAALNADLGLPTALSAVDGVSTDQFERFADVAFEHSAHNVDRNPRAMDRADAVTVYERAYGGYAP